MLAVEGVRALLAPQGESVASDVCPGNELTSQQRAAKVSWALATSRRGLRTRDVAELCGLTMHGAWTLLARLSLSLPIYQDECGYWRAVETRIEMA